MCLDTGDRLYKEKITQVTEKLKEVESGVASEYLNPVALLEDNRRTRVTVAGNVDTLKCVSCLMRLMLISVTAVCNKKLS